jgi:hypothetical protein
MDSAFWLVSYQRSLDYPSLEVQTATTHCQTNEDHYNIAGWQRVSQRRMPALRGIVQFRHREVAQRRGDLPVCVLNTRKCLSKKSDCHDPLPNQ